MATKIELAQKVIEMKNSYYGLSPEFRLLSNGETSYTSSEEFDKEYLRDSSRRTFNDLREELGTWTRRYNNAKDKLALVSEKTEYFSSEEGIKYIADTKARITELIAEYDFKVSLARGAVDSALQDILSSDWACNYDGGSGLTIGVIDNEKTLSSGRLILKFGSNFRVYFNNDFESFDSESSPIEVGVSSGGSFLITEDNDQLQFHIGVAKIIQSERVKDALRLAKDTSPILRKLGIEIQKLRDSIKIPEL